MWYKRAEAQKRFSLFLNTVGMASAFGGLPASVIGKMNGVRGYSAWRWIFILEGVLTCVLCGVAFFAIADFPENARFLNEEERSFVIEKLVEDQEGVRGMRNA